MSINAITINQLKLACRHVEEMREAGVTQNLAIRTLELFADLYSKLRVVGNAAPHHVDQKSMLWSVKARQLRKDKPDAKPRDHFRVEHGTPRRVFALEVLSLYQNNELTEPAMVSLVDRYYKLAVITLDEEPSHPTPRGNKNVSGVWRVRKDEDPSTGIRAVPFNEQSGPKQSPGLKCHRLFCPSANPRCLRTETR